MDVRPEDEDRQFYARAVEADRRDVRRAVHEPHPRGRALRDRADGHRRARPRHHESARSARASCPPTGRRPHRAVPAGRAADARRRGGLPAAATGSSRSTGTPLTPTTAAPCVRRSRAPRAPSRSSSTAAGSVITLTSTLDPTTSVARRRQRPAQTVPRGFLGVGLARPTYARRALGAVSCRSATSSGRTGEALVQLPVAGAGPVRRGVPRRGARPDGPVGVVGASRIGGQILAPTRPPPPSSRSSCSCWPR